MREIRTSGSGGVETDREPDSKRKPDKKHRTLPGTAPPPDSTYVMFSVHLVSLSPRLPENLFLKPLKSCFRMR